MPNNTLEKWEEKTLGDILSLEYGKSLDKSERNKNGAYNAYGANGVKDKTNKYLYNKKSIIVGRKGSAGELNYTEDKFWALDVCYYVKFDENKYDIKFLYNLLKLQNLPSLAKGVKPGINRNDVYALKVKIPNYKEQQRIVGILDEAFENIEKAKQNTLQNLNNAKELFESYLNKVFTENTEDWDEKTIGDILSLEYGKSLDKSERNENGIYNAYGANGVKDKTNKYLYNKKSIIVGRKGSAGELNYTEEKFWALDVCYYVIFDEQKYDIKFLYNLLKLQNLPSLAKGVKPGINRNDVYNLKVKVPNIEEQQKIVSQLDELQEQTKKLEQIYTQKLQDLDELKQSILQKAFKGEL